MALFSRRSGRWSGSRPSASASPDPYAPGSPGYAERHREVVTKLPCGTLRIDGGAPIPAPGRSFRSKEPVASEQLCEPTPLPESEPSAPNPTREASKGSFSVYSAYRS
jgi:hypothetical protein